MATITAIVCWQTLSAASAARARTHADTQARALTFSYVTTAITDTTFQRKTDIYLSDQNTQNNNVNTRPRARAKKEGRGGLRRDRPLS